VHYWRTIYNLVSQVVLQRNNEDPDIRHFEIDVDTIIQGFAKQEEFEKSKGTISELEKQVLQLDRELKQTREDFLHKEKQLEEAEEKLKKMEGELRNAVQSAAGSVFF